MADVSLRRRFLKLSFLQFEFNLEFLKPAIVSANPLFVLRGMLGKNLRSMCCISAGRAFQPSLTLIPKCWFRQAQSTFWNFGLPCPKLYVRKVRYANFAHYRVFALQKLAVYSQICKFSSRILIPSSTLCPSISCIFWNLYFLCRLSKTLRWASFLCRRMKIACALLAAAPSLLGV